MGRIAATASLPYPPERVWRAAIRIEDLPGWMPEVIAAELLDAPLAIGSRVRLRLSAAAAGAEVTASVSRLAPATELVMTGSGGPLGVTVGVSLRETADAGTEATVEVDLETPPFLGFIAREVEQRLQAGLPGALQKLRAMIETESV
jgi:uncharacterized protein YndB with AHSA1/START domain